MVYSSPDLDWPPSRVEHLQPGLVSQPFVTWSQMGHMGWMLANPEQDLAKAKSRQLCTMLKMTRPPTYSMVTQCHSSRAWRLAKLL